MDFMSLDDIDKTIFTRTKHIHLSSIFMQSGIQRDLIDILKLARDNEVTTPNGIRPKDGTWIMKKSFPMWISFCPTKPN